MDSLIPYMVLEDDVITINRINYKYKVKTKDAPLFAEIIKRQYQQSLTAMSLNKTPVLSL